MKVKKESRMRTDNNDLIKDGNIDDVHNIVIILFISMILSAAVAFWPLVFAIIGMIIVLEVMVLFLRMHQRCENDEIVYGKEAEKREMTENDVIDLAFSVAMKRITQFLRINFTSATWSFECRCPKMRFVNNQAIYIVLSNAGGYKRAKVVQDRLFVRGLVYDAIEVPVIIAADFEETISVLPEEMHEDSEEEIASEKAHEEKKINYEFIADEWVDSNMEMINEQLNNTAAQSKNEYFLTESLLPVKESWELISKRLIENGVKEAIAEENGINIIFRI